MKSSLSRALIFFQTILILTVTLVCNSVAQSAQQHSIPDFTIALLKAIKEVDRATADFKAGQPVNLSVAEQKDRAAAKIRGGVQHLQAAGIDQTELTKTLTKGYLLYGLEAANYIDAL